MAKKKQELTPEERLAAALVPEEEQPYELSEGWKWVRIGKIFVDVTDSKKKIKRQEYLLEGKWPIVDQGQTFIGGYSDDDAFVYRDELPVTIFGDHTRNVKYVDFQFIQGADGVKVLKPQSFIDGKFLFWLLKGLPFPSKGYRRHFPILKKMVAPLPPLDEQQRIVARIESLFAKLDAAKEKVQSVLDAHEARKAALLHDAFAGKLTAKWRTEHGVASNSWYTDTLKNLCEKITDGTHHSPPNSDKGDYMYVTAKNIKETGINLENITYVSSAVHEEIYKRCDVQKGDVLYIKDGATTGIATVNTLDEPFSLLSSVAVLRPHEERLLSGYLKHLLNSSEQKSKMLNNMSGNAITRLTLSKLKATSIRVCSLSEQRQIVDILDRLLGREETVRQSAESVLESIDRMKQSILARAFRGEL